MPGSCRIACPQFPGPVAAFQPCPMITIDIAGIMRPGEDMDGIGGQKFRYTLGNIENGVMP